MKSESKKERFQWLPTLLILWNLIDLVLHVAIDMAEPLRIAGNIVGVLATLIVLFGVAKAYTPHILAGAADLPPDYVPVGVRVESERA